MFLASSNGIGNIVATRTTKLLSIRQQQQLHLPRGAPVGKKEVASHEIQVNLSCLPSPPHPRPRNSLCWLPWWPDAEECWSIIMCANPGANKKYYDIYWIANKLFLYSCSNLTKPIVEVSQWMVLIVKGTNLYKMRTMTRMRAQSALPALLGVRWTGREVIVCKYSEMSCMLDLWNIKCTI